MTLRQQLAHLQRLRTQGFAPLRRGRIHFRCDVCGRKQSNMKRGEHDPRTAVLMELDCDKCCQGHKDCAPRYFDAAGRHVFDDDEWYSTADPSTR